MFCPKCGVENSDKGSFCRKCGSDLSLIADVMSGKLTAKNAEKKKKPGWEGALILLATSAATFITAIILAFQPMGQGWWFWLLFAAFSTLALGIGQVINIKQFDKDEIKVNSDSDLVLPESEKANALPPKQTEYASDISPAQNEKEVFAPSSIVESTTRNLKTDSEGKTMTLPKEDV